MFLGKNFFQSLHFSKNVFIFSEMLATFFHTFYKFFIEVFQTYKFFGDFHEILSKFSVKFRYSFYKIFFKFFLIFPLYDQILA